MKFASKAINGMSDIPVYRRGFKIKTVLFSLGFGLFFFTLLSLDGSIDILDINFIDGSGLREGVNKKPYILFLSLTV